MFAPLCRAATELNDVDSLASDVARTLVLSKSGRPGPVLLSFPADLQDAVVAIYSEASRPATARSEPSPKDLQAALDLIAGARRPLLVVGGGVRAADATDDLVALAERMQAPVVTGFRRTDAFPSTHRLYVGALSIGSTPEVGACLDAADLLIVIGSRLSEITAQRYSVPKATQRVIHIDVDEAGMKAAWFTADVRLACDAGVAMRELGARITPATAVSMPWWVSWNSARTDRRERACLAGPEQELVAAIAELIDELLPERAVLTSDAGDFFIAAGPSIAVGSGRRYLGPTSGSMGYGIPAAIAAKLAEPAIPVVAMCGDGGAMMTIQELATSVHYGAPIIVLIFNNDCFGSIGRHQDASYGARRVGVSLTNPDFAELGGLFGMQGHQARNADEFRSAFVDALGSPGIGHVIEVKLPGAGSSTWEEDAI